MIASIQEFLKEQNVIFELYDFEKYEEIVAKLIRRLVSRMDSKSLG